MNKASEILTNRRDNLNDEHMKTRNDISSYIHIYRMFYLKIINLLLTSTWKLFEASVSCFAGRVGTLNHTE